jgi:hypothetical protein
MFSQEPTLSRVVCKALQMTKLGGCEFHRPGAEAVGGGAERLAAAERAHKALEGMTAPGDCGVGSHPERPAERRNSTAAMDVTEARNRSAVAARLRQALAHAAAAVALAEAQPAGGAAGASAVHAAHGCRSDRRRVRVPRMARHELDEGR